MDLFRKVQRDPLLSGNVPNHQSNAANQKSRYNIFAAVTVKMDVTRNVNYLVMEEIGDAYMFREFTMHLISEGTLREGDIFILDNCSIHFQGENTVLAEELWNEFQILMIKLPPYHPELNPTEFVFGQWARSTVENEEDFLQLVCTELDGILYSAVVHEFRHCGYLKNL